MFTALCALWVPQVRCVWRLVLPLLDAGYQVDVRVLDAVFYGVPQTRGVRCFLFGFYWKHRLPSLVSAPEQELRRHASLCAAELLQKLCMHRLLGTQFLRCVHAAPLLPARHAKLLLRLRSLCAVQRAFIFAAKHGLELPRHPEPWCAGPAPPSVHSVDPVSRPKLPLHWRIKPAQCDRDPVESKLNWGVHVAVQGALLRDLECDLRLLRQIRTHYSRSGCDLMLDQSDGGAAEGTPPLLSADLPKPLAFARHDAALLAAEGTRWETVAVTSARAAQRLPRACTARDAIADLPEQVTPGAGTPLLHVAFGDTSPLLY